jgi:branched-chain amino acid aminotransferase
VSLFDRGFLYGDGVYETVRVYQGHIFHFAEHFQRLRQSAQGVRISLPFSRKAIERAAYGLLKANGLAEAIIRITLTRGAGPLGFDPRPCKSPTLAMIAAPPPRHPEELYRRGIRLALARVRRNPTVSLSPALKTINNLNNIFGKMEALERNAYEALMLNVRGELAEGTISNVFFISKGALKTPALECGLLAGVTRDAVIRLAERQKLKVTEGHFFPRDLYTAQEAFITSTTMEVMPVTAVVDEKGRVHAIGSGRVGPWAPGLRQEYQRLVSTEMGQD